MTYFSDLNDLIDLNELNNLSDLDDLSDLNDLSDLTSVVSLNCSIGTVFPFSDKIILLICDMNVLFEEQNSYHPILNSISM